MTGSENRESAADPSAESGAEATPDFAKKYNAWYTTPLGRVCLELEKSALFESAVPLPGERALDVGCGTGAFTLELARRGAAATGVDRSESMVSLARSLAAQDGLQATFTVADAESLPFPDSEFDLVIAVTVLCFAGDPGRLLRESLRVLKPDGRLVIGELNSLSPWAWWRRAKRRFVKSSFAGARFFSPNELGALLRENGFQIEGLRTLLFFPPVNRLFLMRRHQFFEVTGRRFFPARGAFIAIRAVPAA
ncbi:MAG: methyltransferase domain-containing protein [Actinobacteria bacterium]|nr:methyltransferase domain-containing protein [Actinomycetota bacterium]